VGCESFSRWRTSSNAPWNLATLPSLCGSVAVDLLDNLLTIQQRRDFTDWLEKDGSPGQLKLIGLMMRDTSGSSGCHVRWIVGEKTDSLPPTLAYHCHLTLGQVLDQFRLTRRSQSSLGVQADSWCARDIWNRSTRAIHPSRA
jgi:hypothetical protein